MSMDRNEQLKKVEEWISFYEETIDRYIKNKRERSLILTFYYSMRGAVEMTDQLLLLDAITVQHERLDPLFERILSETY